MDYAGFVSKYAISGAIVVFLVAVYPMLSKLLDHSTRVVPSPQPHNRAVAGEVDLRLSELGNNQGTKISCTNSNSKIEELRVNRAQKLLELHQKYGSVIRVGVNEVSISDWRLYRDIYANKTIMKDSSFYETKAFIGQGNVFSEVDQTVHASRRKVMSSSFSHPQLIKNEHIAAERVEALIERAMEQAAVSPTSTAELFNLCGLFSLEVICRLSFNWTFSKTSDLSHQLLKALEGSTIALVLSPVFPMLRMSKYRTRIPGILGKSYRCSDVWESITRDMLVDFQIQNLEQEKRSNFLAAPLLDEKPNHIARKYTLAEAVEESMGIAIAGSGVTEHTMVYFLYQLSRTENKHIQRRLREEVAAEAYRLHPVIMSTLPRVLQDKLVLQRSGLVLPPGTMVDMQNYVHHRDPDLFRQPENFVPERWLQDGSCNLTTDLKDMNSAATPFSVGTRNCLGQSLAKIELYLSLGTMVRQTEFRINATMMEDDMDMWTVGQCFRKAGNSCWM